jgi:hypothetical protein
MTARQAFGVVVRSFALLGVIYGANILAAGITATVAMQQVNRTGLGGALIGAQPGAGSLLGWSAFLASVYIIVGLVFLRGADSVVTYAYPDTANTH